MFIQVIQGMVSDADELKAAMDRWSRDLAPGARGWLGSTAGITGDGTGIALARFESAEVARKNSERPEQHQWWMETSKLFAGEVAFHDCREVATFMAGGSDDAGFVQIIQARVRDLDRLRQVNTRSEPLLGEERPDIIGGYAALHGDGNITESIYFTSENAAREGENKELTGEVKQLFEEEQSLLENITYHDLRKPWFYSPR